MSWKVIQRDVTIYVELVIALSAPISDIPRHFICRHAVDRYAWFQRFAGNDIDLNLLIEFRLTIWLRISVTAILMVTDSSTAPPVRGGLC